MSRLTSTYSYSAQWLDFVRLRGACGRRSPLRNRCRARAAAARARPSTAAGGRCVTRCSPKSGSSCCVPCQSMSNRMSRPLAQRRLHRRLGRAVAIAEDVRPFDEFAGGDHPVELGVVDEVIVDVVDFARAHRARRRRNRHGDVVVGLEQHARDRRFAGAGRRGEDDQQAAALRRDGWSGEASMAALASGEPWPSSGRMLQCTKFLLKWCGAMHIVQCNIFGGISRWQTKPRLQAQAAAEAPAKVAEAVADTAEKVAKESAKAAKRTRAATARRAEARRLPRPRPRRRRTARKTRRPARKTAVTPRARPLAAAQERIETVTNNNFFNGFDAIPAFAPFQSMFADANERSQELVKRSQKVAEELAELARANVEAMVEAGRVAAEGARSLGQDVVAKQPRRRRAGRGRDPLARRSQVADRVSAAAGRLRPRFVRPHGRRELEADRIAGQARRRGVPAAVEPRHGQCRALQHPRCLTLSPPKSGQRLSAAAPSNGAAAIFLADCCYSRLAAFSRLAIF